jgi:hypothetical protein
MKSHHGVSFPVRQSNTPYPNNRAAKHHGTLINGFLLGNTRCGGGHFFTATIKNTTAMQSMTSHAMKRIHSPPV